MAVSEGACEAWLRVTGATARWPVNRERRCEGRAVVQVSVIASARTRCDARAGVHGREVQRESRRGKHERYSVRVLVVRASRATRARRRSVCVTAHARACGYGAHPRGHGCGRQAVATMS